MTPAAYSTRNGSVFFIILLAVAMFAMLSYAVFKGSRSSSSALTQEQARAAAQEILANSDIIRKTIQTLRLRGCLENQISLETPETPSFNNPTAPTNNSCNVFHTAGGKANYMPLSLSWLSGSTDTDWYFSGETAVEDTATAEPELLMMVKNLKPEICMAINKIVLGRDTEEESVGSQSVPFDGTYNLLADGIGDDSSSIYRAKSTGCYEDSGPSYTFYTVLIAR